MTGREPGATLFRFQDLDIWRFAIEISDDLLDIADELEQKRLFKFAEQLRTSNVRSPQRMSRDPMLHWWTGC